MLPGRANVMRKPKEVVVKEVKGLTPKVQAKATARYVAKKKFGLSDDQHTKIYNILVKSTEERTKKNASIKKWRFSRILQPLRRPMKDFNN